MAAVGVVGKKEICVRETRSGRDDCLESGGTERLGSRERHVATYTLARSLSAAREVVDLLSFRPLHTHTMSRSNGRPEPEVIVNVRS